MGLFAAVLTVAALLTLNTGHGTDVAVPRFVAEPSAGIDHVYDGEWNFFVGGGVAAFDCDGDFDADLFMAGGVNPAGLFRNESAIGGALRFEPVATVPLTSVTGAYPIDLDADGHIDLAVLRIGENVLLRGLGDCDFERANEAWGFDGGDEWTTAFTARWDGDQPTMVFGNYVRLDDSGQRTGDCANHILVKPDSAGRYAQTTELAPGWCTLSMLFSDWSRTGRRDLRVTNDRQYYRNGEEQLWRIDDKESQLYTTLEGWQHLQIFGMGIASRDITGDGRPEVFLTSMGDNKLQTLASPGAEPVFADIALEWGATAHRPFVGDQVLPSTAWHAEFADVNNDGIADLYISKGNVDAMVEFAAADPNNLLLGRADAEFVEVADDAGLLNPARTRGAALVDFNLDGLLDLVEVNRRENVTLWRNVGRGDASNPAAMGRWLALDLRQSGGNVNAIGAWVEVRVGDNVTSSEVTIGGGHGGGQLGLIHFGVGPAPVAEVRVQWPDGETSPWHTVDTNRVVILHRGLAPVVLTTGAE